MEYHEIEFTQWEFNEQYSTTGCLSLEPVLKVQVVLDAETKARIGLYFQHRIGLISDKQLILSCIAEHVFISAEIFSYCLSQLKKLIETAHERFQQKLSERTSLCNIHFSMHYMIKDADAEAVMKQLKL